MKFVFALVALLHLCNSYKLNMNLNWEIMSRLDTLNNIYKANKVNITLPDVMRMPKNEMIEHGSSCVSVFVRELKDILYNTTVDAASEHILQELQANLELLDPHQQIDLKCRMAPGRKGLKPFNTYKEFLRKLNSKKR